MKYIAVSVGIVACATVVSAGKIGKNRLTDAFEVFVKSHNVEFNKINYEEVRKAIDLTNVNEKGERLKVDLKLTCSDDLKGENKGKETHITEFIFKEPILGHVLLWKEQQQKKINEDKKIDKQVLNLIEDGKKKAEKDFKEQIRKAKDLSVTSKHLNLISARINKLSIKSEALTKLKVDKLNAEIKELKNASKTAAGKIKEKGEKKEDVKIEDVKKADGENAHGGNADAENADGENEDDFESFVVIEDITATLHCTPDGKAPLFKKKESGVSRTSTVFAVVAPLAAAALLMA